MKFVVTRLAQWTRDTRGQDMIEYALLAGFIAVVVAAFFPTQIAPSINTVFSKVSSQLAAAAGGS
jgi:pilus assembly protein Flp/PilA